MDYPGVMVAVAGGMYGWGTRRLHMVLSLLSAACAPLKKRGQGSPGTVCREKNDPDTKYAHVESWPIFRVSETGEIDGRRLEHDRMR